MHLRATESLGPRVRATLLVLALLSASTGTASSQPGHDPAAALAAQRDALARLAVLDGTWRGTASTMLPNGEMQELTQTERVGPFLDGAVRVVEGRGYDGDGALVFNAFGTISFDPATNAYSMRALAMGRVGDFPITLTEGGFSWEIAAGPATIRYTATVEGGVWSEIGERIVPGQEPMRFFEMRVERLGDTDWPAGGALGPK